jgi:TetR/AcrR family tetracycline transcriptional repressor
VKGDRIDSLRIADEALKLFRVGGLGAVSLRRIAAGLDVGASTLYWHIRDKDALLAALSQRIFRGCLDAVGEQASWRGWLHAFGIALWEAQTEIPDIRKLIVISPPDPERQRATMSEITEILQRLGMAEEDAAIAQRSVQALVTGWTTLVVGRVPLTTTERASFERALDVLLDGWDPLRRLPAE